MGLLRSMLALVLLVGCGANVVFGEDGSEGGAGQGGTGQGGVPIPDGPGPMTVGPGQTSSQSSVMTTNTSDVGPGIGFCDEIGNCEGDGMSPLSGCIECSVLGDNTVALDGGLCAEPYFACFGENGDCSAGGDPDCCAFLTCLEECSFLPEPEFLDCVCVNDGETCLGFRDQPPGTCFGDHPMGTVSYIEFTGCVYNEVCPGSCL